ncbi:conserved hypothetical protein [Talaromyces stipitatus ATCC 10500]|uniref:Tautomerase cis-CaaD-like domain-containing protein n=1 Tax=Talaromyces stipitatus (strain ATCC 10500 / CBS 375.48 / QM 6759 / NRRL 1006) TaxID=441959 RepID=B8MPH1_TALSN|nr:uncharacterized protein TSTA_106190 [Talaromyces stipitatus ATCC 10500]EED14410.1 conserved hypothetical protein [Talaromyces stipitatus ATCC 10500]
MPYWKIYHGLDTLEPSDKTTLSKSITEYYTSLGLPAFYVNIFYFPLPEQEFYVGGVPQGKKISIEITHIAKQIDPTIQKFSKYFKNSIDKILRPYTIDRGVQVEFCVVQVPPQLWRINGIDPPEGLDQSVDGAVEVAEKNRELLAESMKSTAQINEDWQDEYLA